MTKDTGMNLRRFNVTLKRTDNASKEEYSFGTDGSFVVVSLDWNQSGKIFIPCNNFIPI